MIIIDIMIIVNHFQKFGDVFFLLYYFLHIRKGQDGSDEHACDAKAQTPHFSGYNFSKRLGF